MGGVDSLSTDAVCISTGQVTCYMKTVRAYHGELGG